MKKKSARVELYKLPNHAWFPGDWYPPGSKHDTPEIIVRRLGAGVLVRESTWSAAKAGPRYNYSKKFCSENRPNETWEPMDLYVWGHTTIGILGQTAKDGNAAAAEELWRLAFQATGLLTQVCKTKPELLRSVARINRQWPVFRKKNSELTESEKDLFAAIQLGADDFIELHAQTAKWKLDDAGIIAHGLLNYIRVSRGSPPHGFDNGVVSKFVKEKLPRDFDDESAGDWWKVAKEILLFSYPQPHAIDELKSLVPVDSPKRKSPGRFDQAIFRKLKSRFMAFARAKVC